MTGVPLMLTCKSAIGADTVIVLEALSLLVSVFATPVIVAVPVATMEPVPVVGVTTCVI